MELSLKPQFRKTELADIDKALEMATNYLDHRIVETENGIYWELDRDDTSHVSIYSGSAGILIYYLELYLATDDTKYLNTAKRAGDYLINYLETTDLDYTYSGINGVSYPNLQWVYNSGHTGIVYALIVLANISEEEKYATSAKKTLDHLLTVANKTANGISWVGEPGIFADSGITLVLLYAAKHLDAKYLDAATAAGEQILSHAIQVDDDKIKFFGANPKHWEYLANIEAGVEYEWPNFEYGSSGIAYLLFRLFEATQDEKYKQVAKQVVNYLDAIAVDIDGEASLVPYRFPDMQDKFYIGYCHGPIGTSRIYQLFAINEQENTSYLDQINRLTKGITKLGGPHEHSWGYWHSFNRCCGTAGFIEQCINVKALNGPEGNSEQVDHLLYESINKILAEMCYEDGEESGAWPIAWERVSPTKYAFDIGYYDGVAGIASSLLHASTYLKGHLTKIYVPADVTINKQGSNAL